MTDIPAELDLAGAGLVYQEMDPFSVAVMEDGRRVRFHRSVEATVESIAEVDRGEAEAYRQFVGLATPIIKVILPAVRGEIAVRELPGRAASLLRALRHQPATVLRDVLSPYDSLLRRRLSSDLTRGPVAAFAAHGGVGPTEAGGSLFAFWQAAYHLFGQWHAAGGAGALTHALVQRLQSLGGALRCSAPVARIEAPANRVRAVVLESGERTEAANVVTAIDPQLALLRLLDPPLHGPVAADLAATRRGNVVQAVVHVATDRLPPYPDARPGDWNGLQSYVDRLDDLTAAWAQSEAGLLPLPPPLYAFTTSAIDRGLAPPGHHTVYLACPAAPARVEGGWDARREEFVEACLDVVAARAPAFRDSIRGVYAWTPDRMEQQGRWPGAHPMHLDITLDQLGPLRPTKALGDHRTPIEGLYVSGAGTNPSGGIVGTPGRMAALALLADSP
jgi:phytoene dehydrogenase-like protein